MALKRITKLNAALGFNESDVDVCQIFGTNATEVNNIIRIENFPDFANVDLFGKFGVDITLLDIRSNGNLVFLIKPPNTSKLHKHLFVLKIIFDIIDDADQTDIYNDDIIAEHVISKIALNLAKYKITPHAFGGIFTSPYTEISEILVSKFRNFGSSINYKFNSEALFAALNESTHIACILQESFTVDDDFYQFASFKNIISPTKETSIFYYILFQIIYTLAVFQKIGLKHNDLHMDNILVIQDKKHENHSKYIKYTIKEGKDYYLINNGVSAAIIDFGLSVKQATPSANTRVMEHVRWSLDIDAYFATKSLSAKGNMCFHRDFDIFEDLSDYLNAGEANNASMMHYDLYKLILELCLIYKIDRIIVKKIFFKVVDGVSINLDDFLNISEDDHKMQYFHIKREDYPKYTKFTNDYETILDNIIEHIHTTFADDKEIIKTNKDPGDPGDPVNIIESFNINNIHGESKHLKQLEKKFKSEELSELEKLAEELKKTTLNGGKSSITKRLKSKKLKHVKKSKKTNKNNKTNKTKKNYK